MGGEQKGGREEKREEHAATQKVEFIFFFLIRDEAYFNLKQSSVQRRLNGRPATAAEMCVCVACWRFTSWMHGGNQLS